MVKIVLLVVGLVGLVFWILFVFFLAYESILVARNEGTVRRLYRPVRALLWSIFFVGLILDILVNVTIGTLLFLQPPALEWLTLTARVSRHYHEHGFRGAIARFICDQLLDPFESGGHCRPRTPPGGP